MRQPVNVGNISVKKPWWCAPERPSHEEPIFVYLAYVDDSCLRNEKCKYAIFVAVLVPDYQFHEIEGRASIAVYDLLPEEKQQSFKEFKGRDLFLGTGDFETVSKDKRFFAIRQLLKAIIDPPNLEIQVIAAAVDREKLKKAGLTIDPADEAFRICLKGIQEKLKDLKDEIVGMPRLVLVTVDDTGDIPLKNMLETSYYALRWNLRGPEFGTDSELRNFHDGLFFASSARVLGIQLADLCAYFYSRHIKGYELDPNAFDESEMFYDDFCKRITFEKVFPEIS
jgi:hypothetical protein